MIANCLAGESGAELNADGDPGGQCGRPGDGYGGKLIADGDPGGRCGRPGEGWWAARDAATGGSAAVMAAAVWAAEAGPDDRPAGHNLEDGALCFEATSYNIVPTLGTAVLQCVIAGQEVGFACGAWAVATQCRRWALVVGCTCADGAWLRQRDEEHAQQRRADGGGTECGGPECADGAIFVN